MAGQEPEGALPSRGSPASTSAEAGAAQRQGAAEVAPRLATLWVRPGPEESPTTEPFAIPARRRRLRSGALALALLASGAALALGAVAALRGGGTAPSTPAPATAAPFAAPTASAPLDPARPVSAAPAPVARPQRPSAASITPAAPSRRAVRSASSAAPAVASLGGISARPEALQDPAPADRRCVPRALRARRELAGRLPAEIAVRFQVAASGAVGRVEVLGDVEDRDVSAAIEEAVHGCTFVPGSDEAGRPTALPVVMRIRFSPGGRTF